jgi:hypothetical protein
MTQQNAALVGQAAVAAQLLKEQAMSLQRAAAAFQVDDAHANDGACFAPPMAPRHAKFACGPAPPFRGELNVPSQVRVGLGAAAVRPARSVEPTNSDALCDVASSGRCKSLLIIVQSLCRRPASA